MRGWSLSVAAAAMWAGILIAGEFPDLGFGRSVLLLLAGLACLVALLALARHPLPGRSRPTGRWAGSPAVVAALLVSSFALLGTGWAELRAARVRSSPLAHLAGAVVHVSGTVGSDPQEQTLGWTCSLHVAVLEPGRAGWPRAISLHDELWLEGHGSPPHVGAGDRVEVIGSLGSLHGRFGASLSRRGYPATMFVDSVTGRGPPSNPVLRAANGLRTALASSLARVFPARDAGLVAGLALGDTSRLDPQVEEDFRATGLSHLTAVSGENLAMFLAPVLGLGMMLGLGRRGRFTLGLLAIGFFVLLTRAEPSVLRAAAMSGLSTLGIFLGRPRSPPAIMGGAVLSLLAINPELVYGIGFQLSVAATAGMALLSGPISARLRFLPQGLGLAAGTTIGAQAGVTPLLLYHFGVVPTVSIPANLLAFPAVGPGMLLGLLAAAVGLVVRPLGLLTAMAARVPLGYLIGLASRLARSPLPSITSSGSPWPLLSAGIVCVGALAWWLRAGHPVPRRAVVVLIVVLPVFVWAGAVRAGPPSVLTVTFFDVGQGDAALLRSPRGAVVLVDGGPQPEQVATKLAALGVRRIDVMIATHPHADHVAGLPAVLARFPVSLVIDPGCRGSSPYYAEFLSAVRSVRVPFRHPRPGDVVRAGDITLQILGPERCYHGTDSDPNNDSLVFRALDDGASVLFPGDAEQDSQGDVLHDEGGSLRAEVLKVAHHGGDTSLPEFVAAVRAVVAVVSVGPNRYGHPVPSVLAALARDGMQVYRTDRSGDVTVAFTPQGLEVATATSEAISAPES